MVRTVVKAVLADAVLLFALYLVLLDLQWKVDYATSNGMHNPSFSYSILTRGFSMFDPRVNMTLASPPTLDLVQVLLVVLVVLNAALVWQSRKPKHAEDSMGAVDGPVQTGPSSQA
jgi:hypothetical protein